MKRNFHVHVYEATRVAEFDIEAETSEFAKTQALKTAALAPSSSSVKPQPRLFAVVYEKDQTGKFEEFKKFELPEKYRTLNTKPGIDKLSERRK